MAALSHLRVPRSRALKARLKAATGRLHFDRELAAGASDACSPELAQRDLLRLVAALHSEPARSVRSIAAVSVLLTDGAGPMFAPSPHGTLSEVAFQADFYAEAG
jgi:hypothetical protein